jgi:nitrogen PTS system EIIA component
MYLKIVELAESFGVEERVVEGWIQHEGLPCIPDRGRLLFDRAQVVSWAAERGFAAKAGFLAPERLQVRPGRRLELLLRIGGIWRDVTTAELLPLLEKIISKLPGATPPVLQILNQRL